MPLDLNTVQQHSTAQQAQQEAGMVLHVLHGRQVGDGAHSAAQHSVAIPQGSSIARQAHHDALHGRQVGNGAHREAAVHQAVVHKPERRAGGQADKQAARGGRDERQRSGGSTQAGSGCTGLSMLFLQSLTCRRSRTE